jgi:hypothetical protein
MTLNTGTGALFPAPVSGTSFFKLTLIDAATGQISEIVHVTARTGDTLTIVRAQEGTLARAWSVNDIAANMMTAGTLSYILDNYATIASLGTAAARNVGTGTNQIPDMSAYTSGSGWIRFPDGTTIQSGNASFASGINNIYVNFPRAFSNAGYRVFVSGMMWGGAKRIWSTNSVQHRYQCNIEICNKVWPMAGWVRGFNVDWIAIGVS